MDLYSFVKPLIGKIEEALNLVDMALAEHDDVAAKGFLAEANRLMSIKRELLGAINTKFGEKLLSQETKEMLETLGKPKDVIINLKEEMEKAGLPETPYIPPEKPLSEIPTLKMPEPWTAPKYTDAQLQQNMTKTADDSVGLQSLLYFLRTLSVLYQYMHWRSAGTNYYGDHLLFQRLYDGTSDEIDQVAEKAIGISNDSNIINPIEDLNVSSKAISKIVGGEFNPSSFAEMAISAEKELLALIKNLMGKDNSDGVEDLIQGIASKHEEHLYLLQQRNKTASSNVQSLVSLANKLDAAGEFDLADQIDKIVGELKC